MPSIWLKHLSSVLKLTFQGLPLNSPDAETSLPCLPAATQVASDTHGKTTSLISEGL